MKKAILSVSILVLGLSSSCKKSYTCACTYKVTSSGSTIVESTSSQEYSEKMKEKQAKSACDVSQKQLEALPIDQGLTRTASCSLK